MSSHNEERRMGDPKIKNVYNFANGMTAVFNQFGEQMPEYQGRTEEVMPKIRAAKCDHNLVVQPRPDDTTSPPRLERFFCTKCSATLYVPIRRS